MSENIDLTKADLESAQLAMELRLKEVELSLKEAELKSKLEEKPKRILASSPLVIAVISGIIGLIGAGIANFMQTRSNLQLEREKFESSVIIKAIETGDPETATKNLVFIVKAGLIQDKTGKIRALENKPENAPVLPAPGAETPQSRGYYIFTASADEPNRASSLLTRGSQILQESRDDLEKAGISFVPTQAVLWPPVPPNRYYKVVLLFGLQSRDVADKAKEILIKHGAPPDTQIIQW